MSIEKAYFNVTIPSGVRVAYKIFPGEGFCEEDAARGQSGSDWSALYAQFNPHHAIAYLPNHFDRGCEVASLVSITAKKSVNCFAYIDPVFSQTSTSSEDKARLLRDCFESACGSNILSAGKPLLQSLGEDANTFVAIVDAEDVECAFPHCIMTCDNFAFETLCTFNRDEQVHWRVRSVSVSAGGSVKDLPLRKDEACDMRLLSEKITSCMDIADCVWLTEHQKMP